MSDRRHEGGLLRRRRAAPPPLPLKCFSVRLREADCRVVRTATFRAMNATHAEAMALDAFPECFFAIATEVDTLRGFPLTAEQLLRRAQDKGASKP